MAGKEVVTYKASVNTWHTHYPQQPLAEDADEQCEASYDEGYGEGSKECHCSNYLEITKFTLYKHNYGTCIDTSRAYKTALATEHALAQSLIYTLIFTTAHCGMELTEVEVSDITGSA